MDFYYLFYALWLLFKDFDIERYIKIVKLEISINIFFSAQVVNLFTIDFKM